MYTVQMPSRAQVDNLSQLKLFLIADRLSTDRTSLGKKHASDGLLESFAPVRKEVEKAGASKYAMNVSLDGDTVNSSYSVLYFFGVRYIV